MHASNFLLLLLTLSSLLSLHTATARPETFIYAGCSQRQFTPNTPYESNLNSILASVVNSASLSPYNNFKIGSSSDLVYGLYQCRGNLPTSACHRCVAIAVTRLGSYCTGASGGALQLEGCFVRYDGTNFIGVEDKAVVSEKCGESVGYDPELFGRRDALLAYLTGSGQYFRVGGSGRMQGMVQCVQDLSVGECQDCLAEAIGRLRGVCGSSTSGDMFLGKCYARYAARGYDSHGGDEDDEDPQRTLAIVIGVIVGVAILIIFLSLLFKSRGKKG